MKLGDKIQITPSSEGGAHGPVWARVTYIHPQHRYYVAEYQPHHNGPLLRESFLFPHRRGNFRN